MVRVSAEERLGRLLSIVPWVVERGGADIDEIADRFDLPAATVLKELSTAQCYEVPPYGPDNTLGIVVFDGRVEVEPGALLDRPLRLGPQEGFGLLAAGRAALAASGDTASGDTAGGLATALDKLDAALGERAPLSVDLGRPDLADRVDEAIAGCERLEIDYYTASRDAATTRRIDPVRIAHQGRDWYVHAWCHRADAPRTFRFDRIEDLRATGTTFERRDLPETEFRAAPGDEAPDVVVALPAGSEWVVESYPIRSVTERPDGGMDVTFGLLSEVFLERLLLRVGPGAEVLSPDELVDTGRTAATRILDRYRGSRSVS